MSNPGVIKLARDQIGRHQVWFDDNIGESIHFHIDEWRIDFSIREFLSFCEEVEDMVYELIGHPEIKPENWEARFIHQISPCLGHLKEIRKEKIRLGSITVVDDSNMLVKLKDGTLVRALEGVIDINETVFRKSNYFGENNEIRMKNCMEFVKSHGYPYKDGYITVAEKNNQILDGWHRASCLYHLFGDKEIEVKRFCFDDEISFSTFSFPAYRVNKDQKIVLYGAGYVGRQFFEQISSTGACKIVAWADQNHEHIKEINGIHIINPQAITDFEFDYIVIANADHRTKHEISDYLLMMGVPQEKIII